VSADPAIVFLCAFVVSLLVTLVAERMASRAGIVARPAADRWHRESVPLLGGVGIVLATLAVTLVVAHGDRSLTVLALTAFAMAGVGLIDDVRALSPQVKLLAQVLLAAVLLQFGFLLRLTGYRFVDVFVTLFWIVGITNAFNLLDNMDGLAATIALVTAAFRLLFFASEGHLGGVEVTAAFMGAIAGFLVRNFPPAKIFMGDAGSLFLGFFLAGLSLATTAWPYSRGVFAVLVIPVLLLMIPIFDTAFVTATRVLAGRSIAVGGRDHTSHRLVAVGLSERKAVVLLATISAAAGGVALLSYQAGMSQTVVLLALLVIGLVLLGIYLSRARVVATPEQRNGGAVLALLADFQYKRQVMTLALDVCLILLAYYGAHVIRFEHAFAQHRDQLYASLPVVLLVQLVTFSAFGLYRGIWQYTGVSDVLRIVKAASVGTMATIVALIYTHRFDSLSRTVFVADWLLLVVLIGGSRASFRFFTEMFRPRPESFGRVLIYGAGDGGEIVLREILNNAALQRVPVGFVDDERGKHQTRIHGLPVFGGSELIEGLVRERDVTELIVSSSRITGKRLDAATAVCRALNVRVTRAALRLE
jgi:UDP-GlcNAc:undecaprenyl-phosphate GlcNAc-1-phosphate transferase